MQVHTRSAAEIAAAFRSDINGGLSDAAARKNAETYGKNVIERKKGKSLFGRIAEALAEPMILILIFSFIITFGTNLGKALKTGDGDFIECIGIVGAICLSVGITLFMEGSSQKAFAALSVMYDKVSVKALRGGKIVLLAKDEIVVGDVLLLSGGDKVLADGRIVESRELSVDESALTGESAPVKKDATARVAENTPLAERKNMLYSGTFIAAGEGKMIVTGVGSHTEMGQIAGELSVRKDGKSPLNQKLERLTKTVTIVGACAAALVIIVSAVRLFLSGTASFESLSDIFITGIVLVVASVPEGLPAIVAVSLALNMMKLAKENVLIKKLIATETAGAVSVICSDKTGTLTENRMSVVRVCTGETCYAPEDVAKEALYQNFCINSTADLIQEKSGLRYGGSSSEGALLAEYEKKTGEKYSDMRKKAKITHRVPFSSDTKFMITAFVHGGGVRTLIKGAPEKVLPLSDLSYARKQKIIASIAAYEKEGKRVLAFAHADDLKSENARYIFDGFAVIADPVRGEVYDAVRVCKKAGIAVKMLTGDNILTASAIARELKIMSDDGEAVEASVLEDMDDEELKAALKRVTVVARSTPAAKLRIVKALKESGEVVAVTGDGINDAPAIRHADVGIAMGVTGSQITKEAADVVLLNDSFATVVKSVAFGRNVYKNLQRFILFQLTVNLSAVLFIVLTLFTGEPAPFNTLQLLWINVVMDGPPALTLGLESPSASVMENKPVGRTESIVGKKMFFRILLHAAYMAAVLLLQSKFNFIGASAAEQGAVIFTLFITFQLFNAFNSRQVGKTSAFADLKNNRLMPLTFGLTFLIHVFIVQVAHKAFGVSPLSFGVWVKTVLAAATVVLISEAYKAVYRLMSAEKNDGKRKKVFKKAR
ncbi:MAG: calcium-translocating P-type ATPase, PMCA-type [Bacillota bacterium]|nr:MAG: calcium-translocating P-type ATPase, PMCA-type [Bacillota bacterium]